MDSKPAFHSGSGSALVVFHAPVPLLMRQGGHRQSVELQRILCVVSSRHIFGPACAFPGGRLNAVEQRSVADEEGVDGDKVDIHMHWYRDLGPNIRAECVKAMGSWFTRYPSHFLDSSCLQYVGWVLSDSSTPVPLEAVRALSVVYAQSEYVSSLTHFTERFKLEMADGDIELSVRTAVIGVLSAIDGNALLEDEERERAWLLLFDAEAGGRKAVSGKKRPTSASRPFQAETRGKRSR